MAVKAALDLIKTRAGLVMNSKPEFNEILSAAYMERQKMAVRTFAIESLSRRVDICLVSQRQRTWLGANCCFSFPGLCSCYALST